MKTVYKKEYILECGLCETWMGWYHNLFDEIVYVCGKCGYTEYAED